MDRSYAELITTKCHRSQELCSVECTRGGPTAAQNCVKTCRDKETCCKVSTNSIWLRKKIGSESRAHYGQMAPQFLLNGVLLLLQGTAMIRRQRQDTWFHFDLSRYRNAFVSVSQQWLCVSFEEYVFYLFPISSSLFSILWIYWRKSWMLQQMRLTSGHKLLLPQEGLVIKKGNCHNYCGEQQRPTDQGLHKLQSHQPLEPTPELPV